MPLETSMLLQRPIPFPSLAIPRRWASQYSLCDQSPLHPSFVPPRPPLSGDAAHFFLPFSPLPKPSRETLSPFSVRALCFQLVSLGGMSRLGPLPSSIKRRLVSSPLSPAVEISPGPLITSMRGDRNTSSIRDASMVFALFMLPFRSSKLKL